MAHDRQSPHTVGRKAVVDERRRHVASMRLRGMTQREIVENLPRLHIVNARTGRPYSLGIVNADLQAIHEDWRRRAAQDMADHVARILAELTEVKRAAWAEKDFNAIMRAIEKEVRIIGADSPEKQVVIEATIEQVIGLLPEEWQRVIRDAIVND